LEFNENPTITIENLLETNMKSPTLLLLATEHFKNIIKNQP